jgi:tRNA A37 threonylcarbamoyltransferase TsaD
MSDMCNTLDMSYSHSAVAEAFRQIGENARRFEETARKIAAAFQAPAMQLTAARIEYLKTQPLPHHLAVWESEGGAL